MQILNPFTMRSLTLRIALRQVGRTSAPRIAVPARSLCIPRDAQSTVTGASAAQSQAPASVQEIPAVQEAVNAEDCIDNPHVIVNDGLPDDSKLVQKGRVLQNTEGELLEELNRLVNETSGRPAMWLFRNALEQEGAPLVGHGSVRLMMPIMARNGWFLTLLQAMSVAKEKGFDLDTPLYNCALFALTRAGDVQTMTKTIDEMFASTNAKPNATSYNLLIAAHFFKGSVDDAFGVLQLMKAHTIYPTIATYQTLVSGCLRRRDNARAYHTLMAIEQQSMEVSAMTVAQVLVAAANDDNYEHMQNLLVKFENALPAYALDIDRISARRSMYGGQPSRTTAHYRESVRGEPRLELGAINAILLSAYRGARADIALRAWSLMSESYPDYQKPAHMWYCLIGALAGCGRFTDAFHALGHMRTTGIKPAIIDLYASLIRPLSADVAKIDEQYYLLVDRLEKGKGAVSANGINETAASSADERSTAESTSQSGDLVSEEVDLQQDQAGPLDSEQEATDVALEEDIAKELGSNADDVTGDVTMDVDGTNAASDAVAADSFADDSTTVRKDGTVSNADGSVQATSADLLGLSASIELPWRVEELPPVSIDEMNCIISACSITGDLDRAFQTYDEACGRLGLERNEDTFNALLEGCVQTRHLRGGLRIIEEMEKANMFNGAESIHLACRLMLRARKVNDALKLLGDARERGVKVGIRTYQMLARQLARNGLLSEADEVVAMAAVQGFRETAVMPRGDTWRLLSSNGKGGEQNEGLRDIVNSSEDQDEEHTDETDAPEMLDADGAVDQSEQDRNVIRHTS